MKVSDVERNPQRFRASNMDLSPRTPETSRAPDIHGAIHEDGHRDVHDAIGCEYQEQDHHAGQPPGLGLHYKILMLNRS